MKNPFPNWQKRSLTALDAKREALAAEYRLAASQRDVQRSANSELIAQLAQDNAHLNSESEQAQQTAAFLLVVPSTKQTEETPANG